MVRLSIPPVRSDSGRGFWLIWRDCQALAVDGLKTRLVSLLRERQQVLVLDGTAAPVH